MVEKKLAQYGITVEEHVIVGDDKVGITAAIRTMKEQGCELILATGGMSVDPDDQTPGAIKDSGAEVGHLRAPVLPGGDVLSGLFSGRHPCYGPAGLRHVCQNHHL